VHRLSLPFFMRLKFYERIEVKFSSRINFASEAMRDPDLKTVMIYRCVSLSLDFVAKLFLIVDNHFAAQNFCF
jgi:hypothetical protein